MRDSNSISFQTSSRPSQSGRGFLVAIAMLIGLSGCSKMAEQPIAFQPIPLPPALSAEQNQNIHEILNRQDQMRLAAAETLAATTAAIEEAELAEAAEKAARSHDAASSGLATASKEILAIAQQDEIVNHAALRASTSDDESAFNESKFGVALVGFETEIEFTEEPNEGVLLSASIDDFEDVPQNAAREEALFAGDNLLRSEYTAEAEQEPAKVELQATLVDALANHVKNKVDPETIASQRIPAAPQLPLQPMLFNPSTRQTKSSVEGNLRPMGVTAPKVEPELNVAIARTPEATVAAPSPLAPMQATVKLNSERFTAYGHSDTFSSRLLRPIERTTSHSDTWVRPKVTMSPASASAPTPVNDHFVSPDEPQVAPNDFQAIKPLDIKPLEIAQLETMSGDLKTTLGHEHATDFDSNPSWLHGKVIMEKPTTNPEMPARVSEPIEVAKRSDETAEADRFEAQENGPVVDATLADATPPYLQNAPQPSSTAIAPEPIAPEPIAPEPIAPEVIAPTLVPPEVLQDAEDFVNDVAQELVANAIAVGPIEAPRNDFKVRTTSGLTSEHDAGKPLAGNNDFADPESPIGDFVAPMTVTASEVPSVMPGPFKKTSSQFGSPLNLKTPPEIDKLVAHVAALPTSVPSTENAKSNVPPVGIATLMELDSVTWKSRLDEAIELAQQRLDQIKQPSDASVVNLRLLKALRGQMVQMETSTGELPPSEARYWQHQLEAITSMLGTPNGKTQALTDYHRHQSAHKTLTHLRNAVAQLESIASLRVSAGQFCTEITGFGKFRTFDSNRFKAGQKMLVYCEVENHRTVEHQSAISTEFRTRLRGSFAIYDANGKVVQQAEYPTVDDVARKRRRDFYMYMPVTLGNLPTGQYVLHALVEDIHGNKTASLDPAIPFTVE